MHRKTYSRRQIVDQMEKRFKTIMIGALARFEKEFGYLWNNDQEPNTNQEMFFQEKWEDLRHELLDHGNDQMRNGIQDLNEYLNHVEKYNLQIYYNRGDSNG